MKKFLKILIITQLLVLVLTTAYILVTRGQKVSDAFIGEYDISEDRGEITVQIGVASSIGAVRMMAPYYEEGILYLDPYSASYCIYGYLGATNEESFLLKEDTRTIALYRRANTYEVILEKDSNGNWNRIKLGTLIERR